MLKQIQVRPLGQAEEARFQQLMQAHPYLGALPKIGETLWYVASWGEHWLGLLSFSAAAWKCAARDRWIGWDFRHQYDRLKLIANNSRFLILPDWHRPNLGSRILSLCLKRLDGDWLARFGHRLLLVETFVDPQRFRGTLYQAANWTCVGESLGFRRTRQGYSETQAAPKKVFVRALHRHSPALLCAPALPPAYRIGAHKMMLSAAQMRSLPEFFAQVSDPRRAQVLLRCAQEIITNAVRHAGARNLWLVFEATSDGELAIHARDDGRGSSQVKPGNGLSGMRERLSQFGGRLDIVTARDQGFVLDVWLPAYAEGGTS